MPAYDSAHGFVVERDGLVGTHWGCTSGENASLTAGQLAKYSDWGVPTFATAGSN